MTQRKRCRTGFPIWTFFFAGPLLSSGCSICCGPYDYHYPAFPGRVSRADPIEGRVGSIFSDPYTAGSGPTADSNLEADTKVDLTPTEELPKPMPGIDAPQPDGVPPAESDPPATDRETRQRSQSLPRGKWR